MGANGLCEFCQYATGDEYGRGFSVYYANRWRDLGIFAGFVVFNFVVVYVCTWAKFKGRNPFKGMLARVKGKAGKGKQ